MTDPRDAGQAQCSQTEHREELIPDHDRDSGCLATN
jgi:hypothetical protein